MTTTEAKNNLSYFASVAEASGRLAVPERRQAWDLFVAKGLPTVKTEEYRFTPITRALEGSPAFELSAVTGSAEVPDLIQNLPVNRVVFVNGKYSEAHSLLLDKSIVVSRKPLATPESDADVFDLLNTVLAEELIHIEIPATRVIEQPIAVMYVQAGSTPTMTHPRWALTLGKGSQATVLEYGKGSATPCFGNKAAFIEVDEQANFSYVSIQEYAKDELFMNNTVVRLRTAAKANCYSCTLSGKLVRNNLTLQIDGEGVDAHLNGLYLAFDKSLIDNHTVVDHRKPNSFSNELYKGVLGDQGKAVFNGKIFVRPDAQKTNAFQSNRNILLSETSAIHTKPQLEIWADDVKCSHGCTTGQLDEEALFYLRSRGIPKDAAKGLLLNAFAAETLEGISNEAIRTFIEGLILKKLHLDPAS